MRGVNVSGVLKTLLERRLILEAGRKETVGRPMLYKTSPDFLHYFNLADLAQLPALEADLPAPPPVPAEVVTDGLPLPNQETELEDIPELHHSAELALSEDKG